MNRSALALAPILLVAACASTPPPCDPLPAGRAVEFRHVSVLGPAKPLEPAAGAPAEMAPVGVPPYDAKASREEPDGGAFVRLDFAQYELDPRTLAELVGSDGPRTFARIASRADVERTLASCVARGSATRSARPSLRVRSGSTGLMSALHEQAYVAGFEITRAGTAVVGDPRVATTQEGIVLTARARAGAATSLGIDVTIEQTELMRPLLEAGVQVAGSSTAVVVQVPLSLRQDMTASVELADGEVLVLGGLRARDGEHDILFVVDARRDGADVLAAAGDR